MKKLLLVALACCLAACAGARVGAEIYDFGLPVEQLAEDGRWANVALEVRAPAWLDSPAIDYRLLYDDPLKKHSYAASRWAANPASLLAQRLRQQLGIARSSVGCVLRLDLQEFSQVFASAQESRALLQAHASLFAARQPVLAERSFALAQPAAAADARAGARALVAASEELGRQLADWLNDLEKRGRLKSCRESS